jgi:hypothetical protein
VRTIAHAPARSNRLSIVFSDQGPTKRFTIRRAEVSMRT